MTVAVIDYGAGNLRSAAKALEAAGADRVIVTQDPARLKDAGRIVLPGVGAFGACASALRAVPGMEDALNAAVRTRGIPFLGICVGMQLMADRGLEFGEHAGLGWISGTVRKMEVSPPLRLPQIGWNLVRPVHDGPVREGHAYFVHSYAIVPDNRGDILATTSYGGTVVAAVQRDNMIGVQFHPEKSQQFGLAFLQRWLRWNP